MDTMALAAVPGALAARPAVDDPDQELVARWLEGERGAFDALVRRHERRVFRFLLRMLGNREDAEDVTQETFLNVHRHGRRFRGDSRFSTFVYRVAANGARNRRRTLGRFGARLRELVQRQSVGDALPVQPRDPESAAAIGEIQDEVQRALLELPTSLRLPLVLYDLEGLAYREIAHALELPEGTVKSRIHRARLALRDLLRPLVADDGTKP